MLLAIDLGNTSIHVGIFEQKELVKEARTPTVKKNDKNLYEDFFTALSKNQVDKVIIGSVVPELDELFAKLCQDYFATTPIFASTDIKTNLHFTIAGCSELGADRLANCVAGYDKAKKSCIIIDFGTAITFDVVSDSGEFLGGAITPGIEISYNALIERAAKLKGIPLKAPKKTISTTTETNIQSGVVFGFASLTDGMLDRMKKELQKEPRIFVTGGNGELISPHLKTRHIFNPILTLEGLRLLSERNT